MPADNGYVTEKLSIFSGLSSGEIKSLSTAAHVRQCKKNEQIFMHGDEANNVYIVGNGAVRLHRQTPDGKEITLHIAVTGDIIGEHDLLENNTRYQFSATAMEKTTLLGYSMPFMRKQLKGCPTLALNLLSALSRKSSRAAIDNEHMQAMKAPQRVGCFLFRLCDIHGFDPSHFALPYSKATIASKLGMEPESFSRALAKLKEVGVTVSGNEVTIPHVQKLEEYVCGACSVFEDCETHHAVHM